ncbi:MAG TPA: hypothetical protein PLG02_03140, partial [Methylotenera sp.]|nr:hypothetical protein [Methylotenera sp.]
MALDSYSGIPELSGEANAIARRRKIAEMMMAQSQEQLPVNQMAGQVVAPVSWTQGLAKLANAYLGKKQADEADKAEQGLANKRQQMVANAMTKFINTSQGTPAIEGIQAQPERTIQAPAPMQPNQVAPNYGTVPETVPAVAGREAVPAVAGNSRKAIMDAMVNVNFPEIQAMIAAQTGFDTQDATREQALAKLESERNKPINVAQGGTIYDPKTGQAIFSAPEKPIAPSDLAKLIKERDSLPEGSPLRAPYNEAIKKLTTTTEPLVMTVNSQGVPTYTPRGKAAGYTPYVPTLDANAQGAVAGAKETAKQQAEVNVKAITGLQKVIDDAEQSIKTVNDLLNHKGFSDYIGATWKPYASEFDGSNAAGAKALLNQIQGGAFLTAFEKLKGGGAITEIEGKKATDAIARMNKSTSEEDFKIAAKDYIDVITSGVERAKNAASKATNNQLPSSLTDIRTLPDGRKVGRDAQG